MTLKNIVSVYFWLLLLAGLAACTDERQEGSGWQGDEATVMLRVSTPAGDNRAATTRGGTVDNPQQYENSVQRVLVLVFHSDRLVDVVAGQSLSATPASASFRITTRSTREPAKLRILANTPYVASELAERLRGKSAAEVQAGLAAITAEVDDHGVKSPFPMWGEKDLPAGIPAAPPTTPGIIAGVKMLRAVGRAIVTKAVSDDALRITSARIYRMNDRMTGIPSAVDAQHGVAAPTVPATAQHTAPVSADATTLPLGYYLTESGAATTPDEAVTKSTCLVIGGHFGKSNTETYYRIDFEKGAGSTLSVGEILRNHSYSFDITAVTSPGWATPEDAANNRPSGLKVVVQQWEDSPSETVSNDEHSLTISSPEIALGGAAESENYTDIQTDVRDFYLYFEGAPGATSQGTGTLENSDYKLTITPHGAGGDTYRIRAVAKKANNTSSDRTQRVTVKAANLTLTIVLRQAVASVLMPETTFMWITSDGTRPQTQRILHNRSWQIDNISAAWIHAEIVDGGNGLKVWGDPNPAVVGGAESRIGTIKLRNDLSHVAYITVKQVRWIEWNKSFLRGGELEAMLSNGVFLKVRFQLIGLLFPNIMCTQSVQRVQRPAWQHHRAMWAICWRGRWVSLSRPTMLCMAISTGAIRGMLRVGRSALRTEADGSCPALTRP